MKDRNLDEGGHSPFNAYRALSATFGAALCSVMGAGVLLRRFKAPLSLLDLGMMSAATHKIAHIVTGERVTMPLRAPFTKQADFGREGGHKSTPVDHGMRRALGELLTCPHCIAPWIGLGLVAGYVVAPVPTRVVTTLFAVVTGADFLHQAYAWADAKSSIEKQEVKRTAREVAQPS